jgi:hypothetical protein
MFPRAWTVMVGGREDARVPPEDALALDPYSPIFPTPARANKNLPELRH